MTLPLALIGLALALLGGAVGFMAGRQRAGARAQARADEFTRLQERLSARQQEAERLAAEVREGQAQVTEKERELRLMQTSRAEAQSRAAELDKQLHGLRAEHAALRQAHDALGTTLREVQAARAAAESAVRGGEQQAEKLQQAVEARDRKLDAQQEQLKGLGAQLEGLQTKLAEGEKRMAEQKALLEEAEKRLTDAFASLASRSLKENNASFLDLAKQTFDTLQEQARGELEQRKQAVGELVKPLGETLQKMDSQVRELEKRREGAFASLDEQLKAIKTESAALRDETHKLSSAMRRTGTRGRWGEMQLRRVVELVGMTDYCDFDEQAQLDTDEGRRRPDMIIKLPNDKRIIVDAKAPMDAYFEALEAPDEAARTACLGRHAAAVRGHVKALGAKGYAAHLDETPDFVVLFLPGEMLFSAALEADRDLIEVGAQANIILATPTTLIALLRAVHYGWRQEQMKENARRISVLGQTLYERMGVLANHFDGVGKHLEKTVDAYNRTVGSFEGRLLVTARQFPGLGVGTGEAIDAPRLVDRATRLIDVPEADALGDGAPKG